VHVVPSGVVERVVAQEQSGAGSSRGAGRWKLPPAVGGRELHYQSTSTVLVSQ
jgi:hypothetical protein